MHAAIVEVVNVHLVDSSKEERTCGSCHYRAIGRVTACQLAVMGMPSLMLASEEAY